jgi:hypothetical protein
MRSALFWDIGITITRCVISQKSTYLILQLFYAYGPMEHSIHSASEMRKCLKVYSFPDVVVWKFCCLNSKHSWTVSGIWHSYSTKLQLSRRGWSSFPLSGYKTFLRSLLVCPTFKDIIFPVYKGTAFRASCLLSRFMGVQKIVKP